MAGLFIWQGETRSVLSVVICTSSKIPLCLSAQRPDDTAVCVTTSLLSPRASVGLRNYFSLQPFLPNFLPSPLQQHQGWKGSFRQQRAAALWRTQTRSWDSSWSPKKASGDGICVCAALCKVVLTPLYV